MIKITRKEIKQTEAYQKLNKIQRHLILKRNNYRIIEHGVNVASNIGMMQFEKEHNFSWNNLEIIKELLTDEQIQIS